MPPQTTDVHRGPQRPAAPPGRAALVCAFPRSLALALPDSGTVVGRAWLAERGLGDSEVSSAHLCFDRAGGALRVSDAGSRNGTWVNGTPLRQGDKVPLDDGAVLRVGRTLFVYREALAGSFEPAPPVGEMIGPFGLRDLAAFVEAVKQRPPTNVLIEGETGTGKELTARAIAAALGRASPYAPVNVAGVASGVFESQLFGHVAGAFSGSKGAAEGIFVAHDGGTVFLDEIGELPTELQAKLLRLLDNREVLAVGADRPQQVDVLVLSATNRRLSEMVAVGSFRSDLYARLSMASLRLSPLCERREDIFAIAQALADRAGTSLLDGVEVEAVERLLLAPWPRNVRELQATLEAMHRADAAPGLRLWALERVLGQHAEQAPPALTLEAAETAVARAGGNVTEAAKSLGVSRGKMLRLLKRTRD